MIDLLKADLRMTIHNKWWIVIGIALWFLLAYASVDTFENYLLWVYLFAPIAILPLSSTSISSEREKGFINSVFASPISEREYVLSKFLLWVCLGLIYICFTLPVSFVHYCLVDAAIKGIMFSYIFASLLLICAFSALGIFISLLSVGETRTSLSLGFILTVVFFVAFQLFPDVVWSHGPVSLFHLSPLIPAGDLVDCWWYAQASLRYHLLPLRSVLSVLSLVLFSALTLFSSYLIFKRLQNIERFNVKSPILIILAVLLVVVPPLLGNSAYEKGESRNTSMGSSGMSCDIGVPSLSGYSDTAEMTFEIKGYERLHNVSITFSSDDMRFQPSVLTYPDIVLNKGKFNISTKAEVFVKGAINNYPRFNISLTSNEGGFFYYGYPILAQNLSTGRLIYILSFVVAVLFISIYIFMTRRPEMKL